MIIKPRVKDFICLTSHPEGCKENVRRQIEYVKSQPKVELGKRVLVLGASTGYGLASRICATYASGASTIGVILINQHMVKELQLLVGTIQLLLKNLQKMMAIMLKQ